MQQTLRSYQDKTPVKLGIWLLILVGLVLLPRIVPNAYVQRVINLSLIYVILTLGQNLLTGFTGLISLGQAGFFAIGAYTSALLVLRLSVPWPIAFFVAGALACIIGILLGYPSLRVGGDYLTLLTIGFAEIVRIIALNWMALTRGPMGIPGIPPPQIGSLKIFTGSGYYYLFLVIAATVYLGVWLLVNSKVGRALQAMREDAIAARAIGVNVAHYQVLSFAVAAMLAGFAGSLLVHFNMFVGPTSFDIDESLTQMNMAILGGLGSLPGSVLGAVILTVLPEYFRVVNEYRLLFMGLLMVVLMIWRPYGILGKQSAVVLITRTSMFAGLFKRGETQRPMSFTERLKNAVIGD